MIDRHAWRSRPDVQDAAEALLQHTSGQPDSWVSETLAEMAHPGDLLIPTVPDELRERCERLMVDEVLIRMTRHKGSRGHCYN